MGCTCTYSNIDGKGINPFDEDHYTIDYSQNYSSIPKEMTRMTSMSRLSSQRSVILKNFKLKKERIETMKVDLLLLSDLILEEYNLARTNPKYFSLKIKNFTEKIDVDKSKSEASYYFINSSGTKIILKNAMSHCKDLISYFESCESLQPLIKNELLAVTARNGIENVKQTREEREGHLKEVYLNLSSNSNFYVGSIFGFGDFDPSVIVILQLLDGKDNSYPRRCILNPNFQYCGVVVVESEKLKVLTLSNFIS